MSRPSPSRCEWIIHSSYHPAPAERRVPVSRPRHGSPLGSRAKDWKPPECPRHSASVPRKLFVKPRIVASVAKQFLMSPALDDFSVLEHQDLVGVADSGKPVCNHETGPALEQFPQRVLNQRFGLRIDRA